MPGRIVLATLGSLGDLHPFIAIALQLRERGHDVVDNAARVVRLGVARSVGLKRYRPSRVAAEFSALLGNPGYRARAEALGVEVSRENGAEVAARVVERQL